VIARPTRPHAALCDTASRSTTLSRLIAAGEQASPLSVTATSINANPEPVTLLSEPGRDKQATENRPDGLAAGDFSLINEPADATNVGR